MLVETVRHEWADGYRRLQEQRENPPRYRALHDQLEAIIGQLRRRIGSVYTLDELAAEYARSEPWVRATLAELDSASRLPSGETTSTDAAFHLYARGAQDYRP
jgi:DNA-directed RNA polymerase specialized sigma subunit